jgi:RNA polymerase sigma-70 factor (ECF subfamily)
MKVLEALPRYEQRGQPFRAWLFVIVRNQGVSDVRKRSRLDVTDPVDMERQRGTEAREDSELRGLDWVSDRDLLNLIERLPLPQRQVLLLRFMLDMPHDQIATVLDRSSDDVRALQSRAVRFLRERLTPIRRGVGREHRIPMRRRAPPSRVLGGRRHALS